MLGFLRSSLVPRCRARRRRKAYTFAAPTYSSPIVFSRDGQLVWVVNPGGDNVAAIQVSTTKVLAHIKVGDEPQSIATDASGKYVYVANTAEGTVSVIRVKDPRPDHFRAAVAKDIGNRGKFLTGAEPWDIVASTDGKRIFVANSSQDTITVIDAVPKANKRGKLVSPRVIGGVELRGSGCSLDPAYHFQPRGMAVSQDSKKLFVTSFFSFVRTGFRQVNDQGRQGIVCRLKINTSSQKIGAYKPAERIGILPRDSGFTVDKDGNGTPDPVFAWPNQMQSIVIRGNQAFLPNIAASPRGRNASTPRRWPM